MKRLFPLFLIVAFLFFSNKLWANDASIISLSLPDLQWALKINLPGFDLKQKEVAPHGYASRFYAENRTIGIVVSAFLEKSPRKGTSKDSRDYYWAIAKESPFPKEEIKKYEINNLALVEYIVPEFQGMKVNQKNINAYLAEDNYWIDIHLSKANYKSEDDKLFRGILDSISIDKNYKASPYDNFNFGNLFYQQNQYKKAIHFFEKALEEEKKSPTLGKDLFKVLVDLLGISYGISGDLVKAKEIFQWAIKQDPEFPMFYYNLACAYAEMNDMSGAIKNLKKAYQYKNNMLPGETLPDPTTDSSFSKYMRNHVFTSELDNMKK